MAHQLKKSYVALLITFSIFLSGCIGGKKLPNLDVIFASAKTQKGKRPVIIIPGILGSELFNEKNERVWINFSDLKGDGLSLPISPNLAENKDLLVPGKIIEIAKVSSFLPEVSIYEALIQAIERYGGYAEDNWDNPDISSGGMDKYYVFAYDWRLDNVENSRLLIRKIVALKQKLGNPDLRFNILAHSMGGLIARYAAMYGDEDLPANGAKSIPNWGGAKHLNKVFMFGTPNEGSMATLEILLKGYQVGRFKIKTLSSEIAITSPAVFQLLPHLSTARFYDENLEPLEVDLYDAQTWKKYGWSAFASAAFRNKFADQPNSIDATGKKSAFAGISLRELDEYFTNALNRTKAFHDALDADSAVPASISFFAFGSDCDNTQDGAIIHKNTKTNNWETIFSPKSYITSAGIRITKEMTRAKLYAPGDTRVTRRSLLAETITQQNYRNSIFRRNLPVSATFSCETHDNLPNDKIVQDNFLTALISEIIQ
ncbi:hypothetical protein BH10ACI1_BH10ACI1_11910 [soil metagenome]